jgi:cation diffusion facilitator family transporter
MKYVECSRRRVVMPLDEISLWNTKRKAAILSLSTNIVLSSIKVAAAILTGSIGLLSEAVHSATDIAASGLALASVKAASAPPDDDHPFGHGKIESLAGFGESILLFGIVVYILAEAIPRFAYPSPIKNSGVGIAVMGVSAALCLWAGRHVLAVGKKTESLALQSNGLHLSIDSVTSVGVLVALVVTQFTGLKIADPLVACLIATWIAFNAWKTCMQAFNQLIDQRIPDEDMAVILGILGEEKEILSYHRLLTRHSGSHHFIELHIVVPRTDSVVQAHSVADRLEKRIEVALRPAHVMIHVDPENLAKIVH